MMRSGRHECRRRTSRTDQFFPDTDYAQIYATRRDGFSRLRRRAISLSSDGPCSATADDAIDPVPVDLLRARSIRQCRTNHCAWHGTQAARRREGREAEPA